MKKLILSAIFGLASFAMFGQEGCTSTETSITTSCGTSYCATAVENDGTERRLNLSEAISTALILDSMDCGEEPASISPV